MNFLRNDNLEQFSEFCKKRIDLIDELNFYGLNISEKDNEYFVIRREFRGNIIIKISILIDSEERYDNIIKQLKHIKKIIQEYKNKQFSILIYLRVRESYEVPYNIDMYNITIKIQQINNNDVNYDLVSYKWSDRHIAHIFNPWIDRKNYSNYNIGCEYTLNHKKVCLILHQNFLNYLMLELIITDELDKLN